MYGLAAFESIKVDSVEERNIRMKSLGIMAKSFKFLKRYENFLKCQVKRLLESPGDYDELKMLWNKKLHDERSHTIQNCNELEENDASASFRSKRSQMINNTQSNDSSFIERIFSKRSSNLKVIYNNNKKRKKKA